MTCGKSSENSAASCIEGSRHGEERALISTRTRQALSAAKARGGSLGNPRLSEARKSAVGKVKSEADRYAANVLPIIREAQKAGARTLSGTSQGLSTPVGLLQRAAGSGMQSLSQTSSHGPSRSSVASTHRMAPNQVQETSGRLCRKGRTRAPKGQPVCGL